MFVCMCVHLQVCGEWHLWVPLTMTLRFTISIAESHHAAELAHAISQATEKLTLTSS